VNPAAPSAPQSKGSSSTQGSAFDSDRATLSSAGNEIAQAALGEGVRADKVADVQAALAAGTYNVPVSAVASKLVDAMLAGGQ
jgi:negative regulator of flagellin synthesis FlgM